MSGLLCIILAGAVAGRAQIEGATAAHTRSAMGWDPSGQPMPLGNISGWTQVFAANFARDNVPLGRWTNCIDAKRSSRSRCTGLPSGVGAKWWAYPNGWRGTPVTGTYYPSTVLSIKHGIMDYYIHTAVVRGRTYHMISAPEPRIPNAPGREGGLLYGRYIVRARWDALPGYHVSFLLWPDSERWPHDGELDFPEADFDSHSVTAFMHWQNGSCKCQQDLYQVRLNAQHWHTYQIDWLPSAVSFYIDGRLIGRSTAHIPDTPMHWVLQTGTSRREPTPNRATAGHVQVDWAAAYTPG